MGKWSLVNSGGKNYTINEIDDGEVEVRRNDGWFWYTGTSLGDAESKSDALDIITSDSGDKIDRIRKG